VGHIRDYHVKKPAGWLFLCLQQKLPASASNQVVSFTLPDPVPTTASPFSRKDLIFICVYFFLYFSLMPYVSYFNPISSYFPSSLFSLVPTFVSVIFFVGVFSVLFLI
jgi:hypothetical protein